MIRLHSYTTRGKFLIFSGVLFWAMMGAFIARTGTQSTWSYLHDLFRVPNARALPQTFTTCGTYAQDSDCGGGDCGQNVPIIADATFDADCGRTSNGNNICINGASGSGCICQEASGVCAALSPTPRAVRSNVIYNPAAVPPEWTTRFEWWTSQSTDQNQMVQIQTNAAVAKPWECIFGGDASCVGKTMSQGTGDPGTHHLLNPANATANISWYYGVSGHIEGSTRYLKSEVRQYDTFVADYSLSVAPPADKSVVTGETTQAYTVTVTPQGGATGDVTLTVGNWSPSIAGATVVWQGGSNVVTLPATGSVTKTFTIQTDDGTPPAVPPITLPDVYSFRVTGSHPALGSHFQDLPSGLTVQDYRMSTAATSIAMNASGDSKSFAVDMQWLPSPEPFADSVTLTSTAISNLTVSFAPPSPINYTSVPASFQVNLTTSGVAPGSYPFKVTGTGTNTGRLVREVTITLVISGPPDFTWSMSPSLANATVGGSTSYTVTAAAVNSPPGGMVIQLSSTPFRVPSNPDVPSSVTLVYKQGAATITQITLPASGAPVTFTLQVSPLSNADCDSNPDAEYVIRATGTYNPGPSQIVKNAQSDLDVSCAAVPSFTMSASPVSQSVAQGATATYQVTVTSVNGFTDTVDLVSLVQCPSGASCNYPASVPVTPSTPGRFNFVVITDLATPLGTTNMLLTGQARLSPSTRASVLMVLTVTGGPDYNFTVQPPTLSINESASGAYTVDVTPINGFNLPVQFTWTMSPANPGITFAPVSGGLTMSPSSGYSGGTITVNAGAGTAGTYLLDFTATPQGGGTAKYLNGIRLVVGSLVCSGTCQSVCVDGTNVPLSPVQNCVADTDCAATPGSRCAAQTCRGAGGCQPDPLPGPTDCNDSSCYNASGGFVVPPASPTCYQSWPRCEAYRVLKVRKDRQCDQWLSCEDAVQFTDPISQKQLSQCVNLGLCNQLGPNGECASIVGSAPAVNTQVSTGSAAAGGMSKIRWLSGYSSGFQFVGRCNDNRSQICLKDDDCPPGDACIQVEGTFPPQQIEETGLDGATAKDLVRNGTFEELRCDGGPRDGLSCILPSDCRVGTGLCTDGGSAISRVPCTSDVDCTDATRIGPPAISTTICKYLKTSSQEITCHNPLNAKWFGVVPKGADSTAGLDSEEQGIKNNAAGRPAVLLQVREEQENFKSLSAEDARHPFINGVVEDHLKDGNNFLRVTVKKEADEFSGAAVPLTQAISPNGELGYVVSFKFRYESTPGVTPDDIKVQLGLNYAQENGVYTSKPFLGKDFTLVQGGATTTIPGSDSWQTFVFGPIIPTGFDQAKSALLNFVTASDRNNEQPTVFDLDDVTLKPVLATAATKLSSADTKKIERRCRLFPRNDSPQCNYFDENGTQYKGWQGYCMDKDPQNQDLCLTWWPLDLLAGESPFTLASKGGYDDRYPLYYCAQAEGGPLYSSVDFVVPQKPSTGRVAQDRVRLWWDNGGNVKYERDQDGFVTASTKAFPQIRWRDLERVEVLLFVDDDKWNGGPNSTYKADVAGESGSEYHIVLRQDIFPNGYQGWGSGGFCKGGTDCTKLSQNFDSWIWSKTCSGDSNDQWAAVGVDVSGSSPDGPGAFVNGVRIHICDDLEDNNLDNQLSAKVILYGRSTCNVVVQTVRDTGENKAWAARTDQGSSYDVPLLGYRYLNDASPFGAIRAPSAGLPTSWTSSRNGDNLTISALQSTEPNADNPRAGTPYTCARDCGINSQDSKYCYSPALPAPGTCVPPDGCGDLGIENLCQTKGQINDCQSKNSEGSAYCVGRPLGRCSANPLLACATDGDCGSSGDTCGIKPFAGSMKLVRFASDSLKHLFASTYGCWQVKTTTTAKTCAPWGTCAELVQGYEDCFATLKSQLSWDVGKDGPGGGVLYCPDSGRPTDNITTITAEDYCAVRPKIDDASFNVGDSSSGSQTIKLNTSISGGFSYQVDPDQAPAENAAVLWEWDGTGSPESKCKEKLGTPELPAVVSGSTVSMTHAYTVTGTFKPLACVVDHWGAWSTKVFPGTITVE